MRLYNKRGVDMLQKKYSLKMSLKIFLGHTVNIPSYRIPCNIRWIKHFEI